ncbi:22406_t:CDS:2 [Entrophospora sp. SA101]|nr:13495_t:CDS:2 [Entrophospora sp. SA101]CAJ0756779.1 6711_t:CDS:2 [Entrophospora sp. SA101]CAJ0762546.1 22406_t:CDS:2 [Entrophospora sp. SA101]
MDILEEIEESEKGEKQSILNLALKENEYVVQFWKTVKTKERSEQIQFEGENSRPESAWVCILNLRAIWFVKGGFKSALPKRRNRDYEHSQKCSY